MATGYYLAESQNIHIQSFRDIERVLKESNIIPTYEKHLEQINSCISMFENIESNRTICEIFCDYAVGERKKINQKRLLKCLEKVRNEMLRGIEIYKRLLSQKEDVKNVLNNLNFTKYEVKENTTNELPLSPVKEAGKGVLFVGGAGLTGSIGCSVCTALLIKYGVLAVTLGTLTVTTTSAVGGAIGAVVGFAALSGVGIAIIAIYKIAQYKGKERGLKYQQVRELYDALNNETFFGKLRTDNEKMEKNFKIIDKELHNEEIYLELAKNLYAKAKEEALNELKDKQGMTDEAKAEMVEIQATSTCKSYLQYELKFSGEKIQKFLDKIKGNQRERVNPEIVENPDNQEDEVNPMDDGSEHGEADNAGIEDIIQDYDVIVGTN